MNNLRKKLYFRVGPRASWSSEQLEKLAQQNRAKARRRVLRLTSADLADRAQRLRAMKAKDARYKAWKLLHPAA